MTEVLAAFIRALPKAELHLHIEGTLEPEMMLRLASRNRIDVPYRSVEEARAAYDFGNLHDFLNLYYLGMSVLVTEQDFYDLTWAYLRKAYSQGVAHVEIFFDPQAHVRRGVSFATVIGGISSALGDGEARLGISSRLIMCFLRDLSPEDAMVTLDQAIDHRAEIIAVGLDSAEVGNPPGKFRAVFARARDEGFLAVAHAGEEGPADYVREALDELGVARIDHGDRSLEDEALVARLVAEKVPLTVCPLSNVRLRVVADISHHPLRHMMDKGLFVTVNSDDPAYFGGYINENYEAVAAAMHLTRADLCRFARNSFDASFLPEAKKQSLIARVNDYEAAHC